MDVKKLSVNFYQQLKKQNITKPIVLISGGETTVNIKGNGKVVEIKNLHFIS